MQKYGADWESNCHIAKLALQLFDQTILKRADPQRFADNELLLIGHVIRYHRKAHPKSKHKQFDRPSKEQQTIVWVLAGILQIAVNLDKAKDQQIKSLSCKLSEKEIEIVAEGA